MVLFKMNKFLKKIKSCHVQFYRAGGTHVKKSTKFGLSVLVGIYKTKLACDKILIFAKNETTIINFSMEFFNETLRSLNLKTHFSFALKKPTALSITCYFSANLPNPNST